MAGFSNKKGIFIAGTDTGVGKTIVAAGLVRLFRRLGTQAIGLKPVETGCETRGDVLWPEDGDFLTRASEHAITLEECAPQRMSLPASPYRAALVEGKRLSLSAMVNHIRDLAERADLTVVEGAGGLMVPIEQDRLMIDLARELGFPVILVARSALGTVNHTLLSIEALRNRAIEIAGVALSSSSEEIGPEEAYTPEDLARLIGDIPLVSLPRISASERDDPEAIANKIKSLWPEELLAKWKGQFG